MCSGDRAREDQLLQHVASSHFCHGCLAPIAAIVNPETEEIWECAECRLVQYGERFAEL